MHSIVETLWVPICPLFSSAGVARRLCKENGSWADPNLSDCESVEFTEARTLVSESLVWCRRIQVGGAHCPAT